MSLKGQDFIGLIEPKDKRPLSQATLGRKQWTFFASQLETSSWIAVGALLQGGLIILFGRLALVPAALLLLYRTIDVFAMSVGFKRNVYMDGVIMKKFSAQFPDANGKYGNKPADSDIVVLLLGTRSNHPLGAFAPGFKDLGDHFFKMAKDLEDSPEDYGFLGMTNWHNNDHRSSNAEILNIFYFKSVDGLHHFAHSPVHRAGWDWWNRTVKQHPYLTISHETFHAPPGCWESIYANSIPSGINSTTFKTKDEKTGEVRWASPVVDASKGVLRTSAGRMSRSHGTDHEKYDNNNPYGNNPYGA